MSPVPSFYRNLRLRPAHISYGLVWVAWTLRTYNLDALALIGDEAYYYQWGYHLDWAYYDHPAGMGVLAWLSTLLGGHSEFGIRWLNAVVGTLCVVLVLWLGRRLSGWLTGVLSAALLAFGAPYLITSRFLYTDPLHLAAVLMTVGAYWRLVRRRDAKSADGLVLGLAMAFLVNTKYTAYLFAVAIAMSVLIDYRWALKKPAIWWAVGIGVVGLVPVVAWNARHDWASFAWQIHHLSMPSPGSATGPLWWRLARNLSHAGVYFTRPMALWILLGVGRFQDPRQRLLSLMALVVLVPVIASPANSPRNLTTGGVLLLLLATDRIQEGLGRLGALSQEAALYFVVGIGLVAVAVYGVGSVAALVSRDVRESLPQSSIVSAIRYDAEGWRDHDLALSDAATILAVDYSLAGQLAYYTESAVTTAWPQYYLWGLPAMDEVTVVASTYLPEVAIEVPLTAAYQTVGGPELVVMGEAGDSRKVLHLWRAETLRIGVTDLLSRIDFLTLHEAYDDRG